MKQWNPIIYRVQQRLHKRNQNWLALICGPTGTGKSFSGLTMCKMIYPAFDPTKHLAFTPKQFSSLLTQDYLEKGAAIMWDEAGVGIPSREWYSISNREINKVMQTFRDQNLALIMTTPSPAFIDVNLKRVFHAYFETQYIDRERRRVVLKPFTVKQYGRSKKNNEIHYVYPRAVLPTDGRTVTITEITLKKPDRVTVRKYNEMRQKFAKHLRYSTSKKIEGGTEKEKKASVKDLIIQDIESGMDMKSVAYKHRADIGYVRRIASVIPEDKIKRG